MSSTSAFKNRDELIHYNAKFNWKKSQKINDVGDMSEGGFNTAPKLCNLARWYQNVSVRTLLTFK